MNIVVLDEEYLKIIENIAVTKFKIHKDVVGGLVRTNNCVGIVDDEGNLLAFILGAIAIEPCSMKVMYKAIALWGKNTAYAVTVALYQQGISQVVYTSECMKAMKAKYDPKGKWHSLEARVKKDFPSKYLDKNTYSIEQHKIKTGVEELNDMLTELADDRDKFHTQEFRIKFDELGLKEYANGVYSFPLLSKDYCNKLLHESSKMPYQVNEQEELYAQIPEAVVLEHNEKLHNKLQCMFYDTVAPLSRIVYNTEPQVLNSVQFAKYEPNEVNRGNWHLDDDSDITLVVALSDSHTGGGTVIKPYGIGEEFVVPQLPAGHALLFRGKHYMHKGLPVEDGTRNILVFWSES
jgi:hypothetical protein